ncbi:aldehyde dehydrogenase family protein [Rhodococcus sp. WS1]|uniref:aldehyde dehydrogenase family protein n=1 Tax=unclassified Rhodococcus (in: high G+C Gram-positive bacteria) TaxID=192944 RepID=UPI001142894E|nr:MULTISPECIES: aldehyde dehydrogenase family protein [unclassified Rhodococcus (in: high G+C Gram-positive bacteria)]ROZ52910.1 aldehyde dehydrogenase family protein [Rhodococcus sp. WS1]TQC36001.1 aldehyde dehydrogenase family protein [Rhodococcus sp. WS7]
MTLTDTGVATVQLSIGGAATEPATGRYIDKTRRLTGDRLSRVAAATADDARRAVDAAAAAAPHWAATPPAARRQILEKAAALFDERSDSLSATMGREMGAASSWCHFNVMLAAGMLREAAAQVYSTVGQVIPSNVPGLTALAVREPVGVVVGIAPWNAPLILGVRAVAMPLAFGNTVVLKASEETPATHAAIIECLVDAGIPAGVANLITNAPEDAAGVVDALIAHPKTRVVNFTGSTKVGRIIGETAGRNLTRAVLELGGKAPFVVLADADLDAAAAAASFGAFMNQGQICMSTERLIVDSSVAAEFTELLARRAKALVVGDPDDHTTQLGPMVHQGAVAHLEALVADAVEHGATVVTGGTSDGLYYPPTVLTGVTSTARLYAEESFGPLAPIITVDGVDEAIRVANDSEYGLSAALFTRDVGNALTLAQRIVSGICHINGATVHDEAQMPFGGVKSSGFGRFGSTASLEEFTELRWITVSSADRHYPI